MPRGRPVQAAANQVEYTASQLSQILSAIQEDGIVVSIENSVPDTKPMDNLKKFLSGESTNLGLRIRVVP